jgi:hypothetical protein
MFILFCFGGVGGEIGFLFIHLFIAVCVVGNCISIGVSSLLLVGGEYILRLRKY